MGNQWSLSRKIWSIVSLISVAFIVTSALSIDKMRGFQSSMHEITDDVMVRDSLTTQIVDTQRRMIIATQGIILESEMDRMLANKKQFEEAVADQKAAIEKYETMASAEEKKFLADYKVEYEKFYAIATKTQQLALNKQDKESVDTFLTARELRTEMLKAMRAMDKYTAKELQDEAIGITESAKQATVFILLLSGFSILTSLTLAFFVLRATSRTIDGVIEQLSESTSQVNSASQAIASASEQLSQATNEQAASLEETAASIQEMSSMVGRNSENAERTSTQSSDSRDKANRGLNVVKQMIDSMGEINESNNLIMQQVTEGNTRIANIVNVINEIGNKTKVINDIVFQTKLLSFNASVEAARAGEHGKGFAVVAEEVGNLAQMSGNASKEISAMLQDSIHQVESIVQETKSKVEGLIATGTQKIQDGERIAKDCGNVLEEIVTNVSQVADMAKEISAASQEQSQGVSEITKAITQLDQVTQQNAATSEEAASSAEELSVQADALKDTVQTLIVTIRGGSQAVKSAPNRPSAPTKTAAKPNPEAAKNAKVIPLKAVAPTSKKAEKAAAAPEFKKVSGGGGAVPSYDDSRFEDV